MKFWREGHMKIGIKNDQELSYMRESGRILGQILANIQKMIQPGITGIEIDDAAAKMMKEFNVIPSFKGYNGFPKVTCININDQVVHGIPTPQALLEGDIVTIDCGVIYKGFHSDSAINCGVGKVSPEHEKFMRTAEKALARAIEVARPGIRVRTISATIQDIVEKNGYSVVRDLIGHGIGTEMHEDPPVPNYRDNEPSPMLQEGMTIAIEPIITMGKPGVKTLKDGWTIVTADHSWATQVEHTIAITKKGCEVLTKRPKLQY